MEPLFQRLEARYSSQRRALLVALLVACVLSGLGLFLTVLSLVDDRVSPSVCPPGQRAHATCVAAHRARAERLTGTRFWLLAAPPLALAALLLGLWWRIRNPQCPPLVRLLRERPQEVVWAYRLSIQYYRRRRYAGSRTYIVIRTARRERHDLHLGYFDPPAGTWLEWIGAIAPQATLGHSEELERQFRRDPTSLRRPLAPGWMSPPHPRPVHSPHLHAW